MAAMIDCSLERHHNILRFKDSQDISYSQELCLRVPWGRISLINYGRGTDLKFFHQLPPLYSGWGLYLNIAGVMELMLSHKYVSSETLLTAASGNPHHSSSMHYLHLLSCCREEKYSIREWSIKCFKFMCFCYQKRMKMSQKSDKGPTQRHPKGITCLKNR